MREDTVRAVLPASSVYDKWYHMYPCDHPRSIKRSRIVTAVEAANELEGLSGLDLTYLDLGLVHIGWLIQELE